jgi:hypothetical protein
MNSLQEKLSSLQKQKEDLIASVNMVNGAIQLLEQLIKEDQEVKSESSVESNPM